MAEMRMNQLMRDCLVVGIIGWVPGGVALWLRGIPFFSGGFGAIACYGYSLIFAAIASLIHLCNLGVAVVSVKKGLAMASDNHKLFLFLGVILSLTWLFLCASVFVPDFVDTEG
jgi:hypothetical protein